jgi:CBS domain-containing protein
MLNPWKCKVKELMSGKVVSVKVDTPIYQAIRKLVEGNYSGLPVVNEDMTLAGIISEKDMLRLLFNSDVANGQTPHLAKVENYMTTDVIAVNQEESLAKVCNCLIDNQFRRVPILAEGKLVGVVTRADIMRYLLEHLEK